MSSEPEFIEEELPDSSVTVVICLKDGDALKLSAMSSKAGELIAEFTKRDLTVPSTYALPYTGGLFVVDFSSVAAINVMTGNKEVTKSLLKLVEN